MNSSISWNRPCMVSFVDNLYSMDRWVFGCESSAFLRLIVWICEKKMIRFSIEQFFFNGRLCCFSRSVLFSICQWFFCEMLMGHLLLNISAFRTVNVSIRLFRIQNFRMEMVYRCFSTFHSQSSEHLCVNCDFLFSRTIDTIVHISRLIYSHKSISQCPYKVLSNIYFILESHKIKKTSLKLKCISFSILFSLYLIIAITKH